MVNFQRVSQSSLILLERNNNNFMILTNSLDGVMSQGHILTDSPWQIN